MLRKTFVIYETPILSLIEGLKMLSRNSVDKNLFLLYSLQVDLAWLFYFQKISRKMQKM